MKLSMKIDKIRNSSCKKNGYVDNRCELAKMAEFVNWFFSFFISLIVAQGQTYYVPYNWSKTFVTNISQSLSNSLDFLSHFNQRCVCDSFSQSSNHIKLIRRHSADSTQYCAANSIKTNSNHNG